MTESTRPTDGAVTRMESSIKVEYLQTRDCEWFGDVGEVVNIENNCDNWTSVTSSSQYCVNQKYLVLHPLPSLSYIHSHHNDHSKQQKCTRFFQILHAKNCCIWLLDIKHVMANAAPSAQLWCWRPDNCRSVLQACQQTCLIISSHRRSSKSITRANNWRFSNFSNWSF